MFGGRSHQGGVFPYILEIAAAAVAGCAVGIKLVPLAYGTRGYFALGGEWMAIFAASAAAYFLVRGRIRRGRSG